MDHEILRTIRRNKWTITYTAVAVSISLILQIIEAVKR